MSVAFAGDAWAVTGAVTFGFEPEVRESVSVGEPGAISAGWWCGAWVHEVDDIAFMRAMIWNIHVGQARGWVLDSVDEFEAGQVEFEADLKATSGSVCLTGTQYGDREPENSDAVVEFAGEEALLLKLRGDAEGEVVPLEREERCYDVSERAGGFAMKVSDRWVPFESCVSAESSK